MSSPATSDPSIYYPSIEPGVPGKGRRCIAAASACWAASSINSILSALGVARAQADRVVVKTIGPVEGKLGELGGRTGYPPLPYGPVLRRLLRPVQHGFLYLNRWFVRPMLRSPFGRMTGTAVMPQLLLLRTRGRRSGVVREVPLGYVILDGFVYVVAGYGVGTPWYLNLLDNPTVEVVLPGRTIRGVAEPVADDAAWLRTYRALIASFGLIGRVVEGDPRRMDDASLVATHRSLPVVRIRSLEPPGPIVSGPWDPGGHGRLAVWATAAIVVGAAVSMYRPRSHGGSSRR